MAFAKLNLLLARIAGHLETSVYLQYIFKPAAVATISYEHSDIPQETVTFECGDIQIRYRHQRPSGNFDRTLVGGWNRIKNVSDLGTDLLS